ncbi:WD40-repeat-containing domain protein [Mycena alexandri]|uniref:WD40-repeat-containing domain protein n=1 Tax=Mycena alexandri TaxID=1745969 RepID=A0AAD6SQJ6_9AGAR|nr:WD40-repeat-containing domain protein [Mycena alexandri]
MPEPIDVDTFEDTKPKPLSVAQSLLTRTEIVISSDDEAEVVEVAAKLTSRRSRTRSGSRNTVAESKPRPPGADMIDLVSDDEMDVDSKPVVASSSKGKAVARDIKPFRRPSSLPKRGNSAAVLESKPSVNNNAGPSQRKRIIYGGPPSAIKRNTPARIAPEPAVPMDEDSDPQEEYDVLRPFDHPPASAIRIEAPPEPVPEISDPVFSRKRRYVDISNAPRPPASRPNLNPKEVFVWDVLRDAKVLPYFLPRPRFLSKKRPSLSEALNMDHYVKNHKFRRSGGSINGILQHDGRVVVCSNTAGGNNTGATDPYNKTGTLISWSNREPSQILDLEQGPDENLFGTHYSVHSIAYDPTRNILAASGADKFVRTWNFDRDDSDKPYEEDLELKYEVQSRTASPHDLAFKPGESILAIGEQRLTIENLAIENRKPYTFDLVGRKDRDAHVTGSIAWGLNHTSSLIFALSEPVVKNDNRGRHQAFDTLALTQAFTFHTSEAGDAGDALCVDPTGNTAALVTNGGLDSFLRIYDVGKKDGSATQTCRLETFSTPDHEVNCMAFSPDSIYVAIGRDDNRTHVYDSRMLGRGILFDFRHSELQLSSNGQSFFGVVGVKWVESRTRRLGLVTGGNDGCVRLWDPLGGDQEGIILAQADSDIAYFSLGDRFNGEHELVLGDSGGTVYVMDGHPNVSLI